jgi:hypothetical protein
MIAESLRSCAVERCCSPRGTIQLSSDEKELSQKQAIELSGATALLSAVDLRKSPLDLVVPG